MRCAKFAANHSATAEAKAAPIPVLITISMSVSAPAMRPAASVRIGEQDGGRLHLWQARQRGEFNKAALADEAEPPG